MDGNNSLKLVDSTFRAGHPRFDNRTSTSFRWLTPTEVDLYKDEVVNAPKVRSHEFRLPHFLITHNLQISMATAASVAAVTAALAAPISVPSSAQPQPEASGSGRAPEASASNGSPAVDPDPLADIPDDNIAWLNVNELNPDESDELAKCVNTCVERWKAAGPEARKKMFALFAVAGIFVAVCRHGHVLVMCDMIRSGEL